MKKVIYTLTIAVLVSACGTTKKATTTAIPPEGISYKTIENFKEYRSIQLPVEGETYKAKETTDSDMIVPDIYLNRDRISWMSSDVSKKDGDLNFQFESFRNKYGFSPESVINSEILKVGNKDVLRFEIIKSKRANGTLTGYYYGYLVQNGQRAALIMINAKMTNEERVAALKVAFDEAIAYTIETLAFL